MFLCVWSFLFMFSFVCFCALVAGMSEDSDYTSDINYPIHHQYNTSVHQFSSGVGRPYLTRQDASCEHPSDHQDSFERNQFSFERASSLERSYNHDSHDYPPEEEYNQGYASDYDGYPDR